MQLTSEKIAVMKRIKESNTFVGLAFSFEDLGYLLNLLDIAVEGIVSASEYKDRIEKIISYINLEAVKIMNEKALDFKLQDIRTVGS